MEYSNGPDTREYSFNLSDAKQLPENEFAGTFTKEFFDGLKNGTVKKEEANGKVYFEMPDTTEHIVRQMADNEEGTFVKRFFISKEQWANLTNETETQNATQEVITNTTTETQQMKQQVISSSTVLENPEVLGSSIEARVDHLLKEFDKLDDKLPLSKRPGESRNTRERFRAVVRNDILYLKSIKRELKRYKYTSNPEIFQQDLDELERHLPKLERVRQIITKGGNTSEIPTILASLGDINRASKFENKMAKYNEKVNRILQDTTLKRLWNEDMEGFQNYLEDVWSGEIEHPAQCPFYTQHMRDFLDIQSINPTLYAEITTCQNPRRNNRSQYVEGAGATVVCQGRQASRCEQKKGIAENAGEVLSDAMVRLGLIDENDTTKKEAWGKFGKVAFLGLGIFAIYKMFTEKGGKRWAWIGGTAAVVLGMANKDGLYKWWNDAFGKSNPTPTEVMDHMNYQATGGSRPTSVETQEVMDNLISPTTTTISAIGNIKINDLISEDIISTDNNGNFTFNYQKYKTYVENNVVDEDEKQLNLQAGDKLKDNPQWIHMGLTAMGIANVEALQRLGENDKTLIQGDSAGNYFENLESPINAEISKEGFKPKDNESWYQIMYENNGKSTITREKMAKYIREGLIVPKDSSLALYINSPLTNLEHKCMTDCANIRFTTYEELLKAVKLTEWIITEFKGRPTARDNHPFHIGAFQPGTGLVGNIQFNDGILGDTDVIKANMVNNTLKEISPTLNDNKHTYVNYLNKLWNSDIQTVREKVDLSDYPILNAMGIDFYNGQEAKAAEEWLQDIKEGKKFSTGPVSGQPFSIRWTFKNLGNGLVFTAVNGDKEIFTEDISKKFPTLMNHKDEFLAFLNNPANNMWGSAI